jgi:hypothetical protein
MCFSHRWNDGRNLKRLLEGRMQKINKIERGKVYTEDDPGAAGKVELVAKLRAEAETLAKVFEAEQHRAEANIQALRLATGV